MVEQYEHYVCGDSPNNMGILSVWSHLSRLSLLKIIESDTVRPRTSYWWSVVTMGHLSPTVSEIFGDIFRKRKVFLHYSPLRDYRRNFLTTFEQKNSSDHMLKIVRWREPSFWHSTSIGRTDGNPLPISRVNMPTRDKSKNKINSK